MQTLKKIPSWAKVNSWVLTNLAKIVTISLSLGVTNSCIQYHPKPIKYEKVESWKSPASQVGEALPKPYNEYIAKWWEIFNDPVLTALEDEALKNSPTLQKAVQVLQEQKALYTYVRANQMPELDLYMQATRAHISKNIIQNSNPLGSSQTSPTATNKTTGPFPSPPLGSATQNPANAPLSSSSGSLSQLNFGPINQTYLQVTPELSYEVDFWGRYAKMTEAQDMQVKASEEALKTAYLILTSNVAQNYYELNAIQEQVDLYRRTIVTYQKSYQINLDRFNDGISSSQDYLQAEVILRQAEGQLEELLRSRALSENSLATLIGKPASLFSYDKAGFTPKFPVIPVVLPMDILKNRPDVRQIEDIVEANRLQVGVAKTAFFPAITLTGTAGYESRVLHNLFHWKSHVLSATAQAITPIFDGFRNISEVRRTKAVYKQSVYDFLNTVLTAFQEAENALFTVSSADREIQKRELEVMSAEELYDISQLKYINGLTTYLDVLYAEQISLQAQTDYILATRERVIATISLVKSLGGIW